MMEVMNINHGPFLPPGFRFHPTDQELIIHYLTKKLSSSSPVVSIIADVDIYKFNPWELPDKARFGESEWFFFSPRDRKYPNGTRPNRAAASGYWKATGTDKPILSSGGRGSQYCLGVKKALVFYQGRPPKGTKTNWMMLEYKLIDDTVRSQRLFRTSMRLDDWVLCRVRQKSKTPHHHIKQHYTASTTTCNTTVCSHSPITSGFLQGQDHQIIKNKNNIVENSIDGFQAYLMAASEIEEANHDDHGEANYSDHRKAMPVSSNEEALEHLRKALSVGALDELVPSTCDYNKDGDNESIFQVSSPATSASTSPYFPQFII